jgi:enoyl-[acyl-carrier protein] reductase II
LKNEFFRQIDEAETRGAEPEELKQILGRARAKRGMFEGDLHEGELEVGQVSALIHEIKPAAAVVEEIMSDYHTAMRSLSSGVNK